jgi:hypothetical protein
MTGIDRLISTSLSHIIKKTLTYDDLKILERKLFFEYGMSIKLSIEHFDKFTKVFKKFSNIDIKKFESDCINKVVKIKKLDENYSIQIIDPELIELILELSGDSETRKIFTCIFENELTIPQILNEAKVPKTSGYRKIENLILNGLILESGRVLSESKRISKYRCVFGKIIIKIEKNNVVIQGITSKKIFDKSSCIKIPE